MASNNFKPNFLSAKLFIGSLLVVSTVSAESTNSSRGYETRPYSHIQFFKSDKISEQGVAKALYQTLDNPSKVSRQLLTGALAKGLDSLDMLEPVEDTVKYVKENTEFNFGQCGEVKLRKQFRAATCIQGFGSVQLKSDYDLDEVAIEFEWHF
ncbi:hypothetical protein H0A36_20850 [Endozoicomonas sp. SM1973]|uniref:Uncharacterized protein n=1 Tax=Spartinivicinus marinus TaxID=2994442 RepID=A0A853I3F0_9GAMM|nr:hypothetical protein [Spartinivicinus marinus]MCX4026268.1 hypothetical protein [Spartinivicinus marinus]NYZ68470.1 hypothetical protein [Spartinivicinus marinus]